jgi:hypothetical protein
MDNLMRKYWLAHRHWVCEAMREGHGRWRLATDQDWQALAAADPMLAAKWREEQRMIQKLYGGERAPWLWVRVD